MVYFSRTGDLIHFVVFLLLCILWSLGGILLVQQLFTLKRREILVTGLATGFLLFISASNILAQLLPLPTAYWISAVLILFSGASLALISKDRTLIDIRTLKDWPQIAALAGIILIFTLILRGLTIFDDHYHLPLISTMATGDIPPHFYFDPVLHLPYHYGLQLFAAGLMRVGGLFPWIAWDISRAIMLGFTALLGWLWVRRLTRSRTAAYLGGVLFVLGSGTRWLLLFLPPAVLNRISVGMHMLATGQAAGGNLVSVLTARFPMESGNPPFPFAYANGLLEPLIMQLGATGAMWEMTVLLLLLLYKKKGMSVGAAIVFGLLMSSLALSAEHVYALLTAGLGLVLGVSVVIPVIRRRRQLIGPLIPISVSIAVSAVLTLFQGGFISDFFLSKVAHLRGREYPMMTTDFQAFSPRWPPAVPTGHLGPLSLSQPEHLLVLLAEAGPALLLVPLMAVFAWAFIRRSRWLDAGLALGAVLSLVFPIFVKYGLDFNITRMVGASLWLSMALAFPFLWNWLARARRSFQVLGGFVYGIAVYGGLVLLSIQFTAMPNPQMTYFIREGDLLVSREYWDEIETDVRILDNHPERSVVVFGRPTYAGDDVYQRFPEWQALVEYVDPVAAAQARFSHIYLDNFWWGELSADQKETFRQACVHLVFEKLNPGDYSFRRLYDIRECVP